MIEFAAICLAANIYFEARNQPLPGQIAVAQVTMNRANHDLNKVCETVLKRKQFSWLNGKTEVDQDVVILAAFKQPKDKKAWVESKRVANMVLDNKVKDHAKGATHYHTKRVDPKWNRDRNIKKVTVIGDHIFYKQHAPVTVAYSQPVEKEAKVIKTAMTKTTMFDIPKADKVKLGDSNISLWWATLLCMSRTSKRRNKSAA